MRIARITLPRGEGQEIRVIRGLFIVVATALGEFFLIDLRDFPNSHQNDGNPGHRPAVTCTYRCRDRFHRHDLRLRLCAATSAKNREDHSRR